MELLIEGDGPAASKEIAELREWLHEARLRDVEEVSQQKRPPGPGEQGPELLQLLNVVLAAPAVLALVASLRAYIVASRPSMTITVKTKAGSVKIDARNPPPMEELERLAKTLTPT